MEKNGKNPLILVKVPVATNEQKPQALEKERQSSRLSYRHPSASPKKHQTPENKPL